MNNSDKNGITLYFADATALSDDGLFSEIYGKVSGYRQKKTDRYRFGKDKNLSLCAEYLLMCACEDHGISYGSTSIILGENGKPSFENYDVNYNLSHSENMAMCAMSDYTVGCDVEKIGRSNLEIAERYFSEEEYGLICSFETDEEKNAMFCRIWTLKESIIKCNGRGMSAPLGSFSTVIDGKIINEYKDGEKNYLLFGGKVNDDYMYAVCVNTDRNDVNIIKKHIDILSER